MRKIKAIALYSGGLDSILVIKLIKKQNIDVIGLRFETPFTDTKKCSYSYEEEYLNIPFIKKDISADFQKILSNPRHGYGKNINPCIDCRILMFRKAGEIMEEKQASFIVSGEVLGQRPMTQNKKSLLMISDESNYGEWIIRPLSALLLPETEPEKRGLVDRSHFLDIQGRSRKRQIELANIWGLKKYPAPASGCKLTEPGFAKRLKDLLTKTNYTKNDIDLLKVGRHFTLDKQVKLVVGRNEKENNIIYLLASRKDYLLSSGKYKGPVSLLRVYNNTVAGNVKINKLLDLAGKITARYCDKPSLSDLIDINITKTEAGLYKTNYVLAFSDQEINKFRI